MFIKNKILQIGYSSQSHPVSHNFCGMGGQAMLFSVVLFVFLSMAIIGGLAGPVVRDYRISRDTWLSSYSYYLAESGIEDVYYRLLAGLPLINNGEYIIEIGNHQTSINVGPLIANQRTFTSVSNALDRTREIQFVVNSSEYLTMQSGLQFGKGGLLAQGANSTISGGVVSAGVVSGSNSNIVSQGGIISSGSLGAVEGLRVTSNTDHVYAHNIINSVISGFAHYKSIDGISLVGGTVCPNINCFSNVPDKRIYSLPISDKMISKAEQAAAAGGVYGGPCPYNINSGSINLGPKLINCSVINIGGTANVTLNGPIWVRGDINISGSARLLVGPSLANASVMMIADNPVDRTTSSKISVNTAVAASGLGTNSFVILVSKNNDAENGGGQDAIDLINTGASNSAMFIYANHGHIDIQTNDGSGFVRLVSGYKGTLTGVNTNLSARSSSANINFPPGQLNIWNITQWIEI